MTNRTAGPSGYPGLSGPSGPSGPSGLSGLSGPSGLPGPSATSGPSAIPGPAPLPLTSSQQESETTTNNEGDSANPQQGRAKSVKRASNKPTRLPVRDLRRSPYATSTLDDLYALAVNRQIHHCQPSMRRSWADAQRSMLLRMLREDDWVKDPYLKWKVADLKLFARQKQIPTKGLKRKQEFINALTNFDAQRSFRFMDLPAELRNMIYIYATLEAESATTQIGAAPRKQPPLLNASKVIRCEMLPTYYNNITLPIKLYVNHVYAPLTCHVSPQTILFLQSMQQQPGGPSNLRTVRFLKVTLTFAPTGCTWVFELDLKKSVTQQLPLLHGKGYGHLSCLCGLCPHYTKVRLDQQALTMLSSMVHLIRPRAMSKTLGGREIADAAWALGNAMINGGFTAIP